MVFEIVGLQLLLTAISALVGAGVLLWLQTIYRRIKLLRGLEEELKSNLLGVSNAATRLYQESDKTVVRGSEFSNEVYRTIKTETPLLYARISHGLSPIPQAYTEIEMLRSLTLPSGSLSGDLEEILKDFEMLEGSLFRAHNKLVEVQQESLAYRLYKRFVIGEKFTPHPSLHTHIRGGEKDEYEEVIWRPSGRTSEEQREVYQP